VAVTLLLGCSSREQGTDSSANPTSPLIPTPTPANVSGPANRAPGHSPAKQEFPTVEVFTEELSVRIDPASLEAVQEEGLRLLLARFYGGRGWRPAFLEPSHSTAPTNSFYRFILAVHELGLNPFEFRLAELLRVSGGSCRMGFFDDGDELPELESALAEFVASPPSSLLTVKCFSDWWPSDDMAAKLDVSLAATFFELAGKLAGRQSTVGDWQGAERAVETLVSLLPRNQRYFSRVAALRRFLPYWSTGSFPVLGRWGRLSEGDFGPRVARLKRRLVAEGYMDPETAFAHKKRFDRATRRAVLDYRSAYGLRAKGAVDREMLDIVSLKADSYVKELWRSLNATLTSGFERGRAYILVNVPEYMTYMVSSGRMEGAYRCVVGFPYQESGGRTPVLKSVVDYVDFNPTWAPTPWVLENELKRKAGKDRDFFKKNNFVIRDGKYIQTPGPHNTLGQVVIGFANENNISLHGTNEPRRFNYADRALSHGCIRVENVEDLAGKLLAVAGVTPKLPVDRMISRVVEKRFDLSASIPIYITYDRVRVLESGQVAIVKDPYKLKKKLAGGTSLEPLLKLIALARKGRRIAQNCKSD